MNEFDDKVFSKSKFFLKELEKNESIIFSKNFYPFLAIFIVSIGFAVLLFYNFRSNIQAKEIPLIKASLNPIKVKPIDAGGVKIANTDKLVYNNLLNKNSDELPKVERILPLPEKPLDVKEVVRIEHPKEEMPNEIMITNIPEDTQIPAVEDSKQIDIKKLPDTAKSKITNLQVKEVTDKNKKYKIQLASFKNEREALNEWRKIKHNHINLLSNFEPIIQPKEILGKGRYYRLYLGAFNSESDVRVLCKKLIKQNQACLIVKE